MIPEYGDAVGARVLIAESGVDVCVTCDSP